MRIFQILEFNQFNTGSVHQMFQAASRSARARTRRDDRQPAGRGAGGEGRARRMCDSSACRCASSSTSSAPWKLRQAVSRERSRTSMHVHKGVAHALALAATFLQPVRRVRRQSRRLVSARRLEPHQVPDAARVDRVVTVCEQIKDVIVASGGLPREKVVVDLRRDGRRALRSRQVGCARVPPRERRSRDDRFLIAQVGVRDWKGWKELIDAVATILPTHPHVHLALIGCRDDERAGRGDALRATSAASATHVTPIEYRDDMPNVFASCDLVVDASWAGTGITGTIREAMAMRKPVIATDCGGNRELVSSPDVGWLIPAKEVAPLARAIAEVIDDEPRRARVAANAREHVVRGFSKELRITRLERALHHRDTKNTKKRFVPFVSLW